MTGVSPEFKGVGYAFCQGRGGDTCSPAPSGSLFSFTISSSRRKRSNTSCWKVLVGSSGISSTLLTEDTAWSSSWQGRPRLVQFGQGNCRLHRNLRDRQNKQDTGRDRADRDELFSTRPIINVTKSLSKLWNNHRWRERQVEVEVKANQWAVTPRGSSAASVSIYITRGQNACIKAMEYPEVPVL